MERAPDPFGERSSPRPPAVLAGGVNGRDGKPTASMKYPKASARMREHLAPQARTLGRDHAAPDAMLANIPVPQRERQALAAHRAVLADGDRSGSLLPGLLRPRADREPHISVEAAFRAPGLPDDSRPCPAAH